MVMINTIRGEMHVDRLDKIDGFEQREHEFVIWTEYRVKGDPPLDITDQLLMQLGRGDKREVVRRDCHVILKAPSVTADAVVASLT